MTRRGKVSGPAWRVVGLILAVVLPSACANFRHLDADVTALQNTAQVSGEVMVQNDLGKPIVVLAVVHADDPKAPLIVHRAITNNSAGPYLMHLEAGRYWFAAFEDANVDDKFQDGERGTLVGPIVILAHTKVEGPKLVVEKPFTRRKEMVGRPVIHSFKIAVGTEGTLKDERFGPEPARKGLWEPVRYARENDPGVYFLGPYDTARIPVLFVHGMGGYPQEFTALIERLDKKRFQPWVFMYPSGYELKSVGQFLNHLVSRLSDQHKFGSLCLVAHSMGGLVARQFLGLHEAERPQHTVKTFVTINSPLAGIPSASWGVRMAPAVVPSWYDVAPDSQFLKELYKKSLSDSVEYHLLFAFDDSGNSDSVVPLLSQLRVEAQGEAELVRGYRATHTGSLHASEAVALQVMRALDRCAGPSELSLGAPRPPEPSVAR